MISALSVLAEPLYKTDELLAQAGGVDVMKDNSPTKMITPRRSEAGLILREGAWVAVIGVVLAFAANALSPRGLSLGRDYFPRTAQFPVPPVAQTNQGTNLVVAVPVPSPMEILEARLRAKGLQLIASNQVVELFRDARYEQGLFVFIDARDDRHYQAGHIPGAYQFDRYRPENYFAAVLTAAMPAQQIVIYCTGGECEDSEFTAIMLRDAGLPQERIHVFGGGMTEWEKNNLPVEIGGRRSGKLRTAKQ